MAGICGLYCGDCPNYLAPRLGDHETLSRLAAERGVSPEAMACDGCLSSNVAVECRECSHGFRACAEQHGVTWCFECGEFPCARLASFKDIHVVNGVSHHGRVVEKLRSMRTMGVEDWVKKRAAETACACGRPLYWHHKACPVCGISREP